MFLFSAMYYMITLVLTYLIKDIYGNPKVLSLVTLILIQAQRQISNDSL